MEKKKSPLHCSPYLCWGGGGGKRRGRRKVPEKLTHIYGKETWGSELFFSRHQRTDDKILYEKGRAGEQERKRTETHTGRASRRWPGLWAAAETGGEGVPTAPVLSGSAVQLGTDLP